jgi:hypothetical protein
MEQQREMNLFDLCAAIARNIVAAGKWVVLLLAKMIKLTYRQWWVVLIAIVLACAASSYYSRKSNRKYEVNAVVVLNGATKDVVAREYQALNQVNVDFEQQNMQALLNLSPEIGASISHFETFDVIDLLGDSTIDVIDYDRNMPMMDTLYVRLPNMLALRYRTELPNATPQVQEAIINYLNTRTYIQGPYAQFHANLQRAATFHHDQLEKLDSLTSAFYFSHNQAPQAQTSPWHSGLVFGTREIELFLEDVVKEIDEINYTDMRLALATAPVVLQSPFVVDAAALNRPLNCLPWAILIGWLLGLVVASVLDNRKAIRKWLKN